MEGSADRYGNISGYTDESIVAQRIAGNPCVKDESGAPWILPFTSQNDGWKPISMNSGKAGSTFSKEITQSFCSIVKETL